MNENVRSQFIRNIGIVTEEEQAKIKNANIAIVGMGCTGAAITEYLARTGVEHFVLVDGDVYEETNINRQIFATYSTLGKNKAEVAAVRVKDINPHAKIEVFNHFLTLQNCSQIIGSADVCVSGVDDTLSMVLMAREAKRQSKPWLFILSGVIPFSGVVTFFYPDSPVDYETLMNIPTKGKDLHNDEKWGERLFRSIAIERAKSSLKRGAIAGDWFQHRLEGGPIPSLGTVSNICAIIAANELIKFLIKREGLSPICSPDLLMFDFQKNELKVETGRNNHFWFQGDF
jgi:molybdopterin/thiamine biosynthesis adenylyltransferase